LGAVLSRTNCDLHRKRELRHVKEEIFGPVFTPRKFSSYEEVIEESNDVIYGLGASVWSKNVTITLKATKDLRFGTVWINDHVPVPAEMPWPA